MTSGRSYESSTLWQSALSARPNDPHHAERARLAVSFESARQRAGQIASLLPRDEPGMTVHDLTHLDALWHLSDQLLGEAEPLSPTEAYVLGIAILVHDLGMTVAAYPGGVGELESTGTFRVQLSLRLRDELGGPPPRELLQNPPDRIRNEVRASTLRALHAERAEMIPVQSWPSTHSGEVEHLITDADLRGAFGAVAGQVGASHWWPPSALTRLGGLQGAPGFLSPAWTVEPVRIACLLRAADAAHLDGRRAPAFLQAVDPPLGVSEDHWLAQSGVNQPVLEGSRLKVTAPGFGRDRFGAWWQLRELIGQLDTELDEVDSLLVDLRLPRLSAHGVLGAKDPLRLAEYVPAVDWLPYDTTLKIGDVRGLVERFGGKALYGDAPTVPLRELVENGADSVRSAAAYDGRRGEVSVRTGVDLSGRWFEVGDNGVGMTPDVICNELLDFGNSGWLTGALAAGSPSILEGSFSPTGRFGVGFFSVFMFSKHVVVTSRSLEASPSETYRLIFENGLTGRPLLEVASPSLRLSESGTTVRFWPDDSWSLRDSLSASRASLRQFCEREFPMLDVDLIVEANGAAPLRAIVGSDWLRIGPDRLLERVGARARADSVPLTTVERDGVALARGTLPTLATALDGWGSPKGVVAAGGARTRSYVSLLIGVVSGSPTSASRERADPDMTPSELLTFVERQLRLIESSSIRTSRKAASGALGWRLGLDPLGLQVANTIDGYLTLEELRQWIGSRSEVLLSADIDLISSEGWGPGDEEVGVIEGFDYGVEDLICIDETNYGLDLRNSLARADEVLLSLLREEWGASSTTVFQGRDLPRELEDYTFVAHHRL